MVAVAAVVYRDCFVPMAEDCATTYCVVINSVVC